MMAPLGETIAVIDRSGKVVSTSKQLFGVFSHAKAAYQERKAQFNSERSAKLAEQQALAGLATYQIEDSRSVAGSQRSRRSRHHSGRSRRPSSRYEQDLHSSAPRGIENVPPTAVTRRHTHHDITSRQSERPLTARSKSDANIDMDLAYGEAHPKALAKYSPQPQNEDDQKQLDGLVEKAKGLLEEAHCLQHSATQTMSHLQKNPDAMAAVALTLAEISKVASKLAPSALTAFKAAAPTVFALLSSPQFLIAAGVGLSATVVMFGGYKIIKQIQGDKEQPVAIEKAPSEMGMEDLMELNVDELSHVEMWRRGVADMEAISYGTSVDGEFITPTAAAMSGIDVTTARLEKDPRFKFADDGSMASSRRSRRSRATRKDAKSTTKSTTRSAKEPSRAPSRTPSKPPSQAPSKAPSRGPSRTSSKTPSKAPSKVSSKAGSVIYEERRPKEKKKGPSRLRLMFTA